MNEIIPKSELEIQSIELAETIPSKWYFDPFIFKTEQHQIFSETWQLVGSESKIPNLGDTLITEIGENPILVSRQPEGKIKAFYNVCRHRGGPLLRKNACVKSFQCKYHGWVYNRDGTLRSTREFDGVENFDFENHGLVSIHLESWMGLIFVNLSESPKLLDHYLSGIKERLDPLDFTDYQFHSRESYNIRCNWKVYLDNYLEGYHIPLVHPKLNTVVDYKSYKTELFEYYSLQSCPIDPEISPYGKTELGTDLAYYFTIFPNILLNIAPGRLQTNIVEPTGPTSCVVHFDFYFENPNKTDLKSDFEFSELVQQEDIQICEDVQRGLESKAYDKGRFSVQSEKGVHHFQSLLKQHFSSEYNG